MKVLVSYILGAATVSSYFLASIVSKEFMSLAIPLTILSAIIIVSEIIINWDKG